MALKNLAAEMTRAGVSVDDISKTVGRTQETVRNWLSGRTEIPIGKAMEIKERFFPSESIEYLYRSF